MFKRFTLLFLLASGLLGCICGNDYLPFWNLTDFTVRPSSRQQMTPLNGIITTDTLRLNLELETELLAGSSNDLHWGDFFTPSLYSLSCPLNGDQGMKDELVRIVVTSDHDFNGISAGSPLNEIIRVEDSESLEPLPPHYTIELLYLPAPYLSIVEKPAGELIHRFTVRMEFESGRVLERTAEEVEWR